MLAKITLAMVRTGWIRGKTDRGTEICHRQRAEINTEAAGRKRGKGLCLCLEKGMKDREATGSSSSN